MYRFSKKEDYAFILISELAENYKKKLVPLSEVSKKYDISFAFLRKIANELKHYKIIKAIEGVRGGYFLAKEPRKLRVADILSCFSPMGFFQCFSNCPRENKCPSKSSWQKINQEFLNRVYNLSLAEFIDKK